MRPDEFSAAVNLLPRDLRDRVTALRPYLRSTRCADCERIADTVSLALTAARYDELTVTAQLLGSAERLAAGHGGEHGSPCRSPASGPHGRGRVTRWAKTGPPLVAATDASWKDRAGGIGYVVSDGRWGLRARRASRLDPTGPSRVLINELRAVEFLLTAYAEPPAGLAILVDSTVALGYLHRWQAGETAAMPAGYNLRPRRWSDRPTLIRLAELAARRPDLMFTHVKGHSGHLLNEAADALASMARRGVRAPFDAAPRAASLVDAFLRDWHTAENPTVTRG